MKNKINCRKLTGNVLMAMMFLSFGITFYGAFSGKSLVVFLGMFLMQTVSVFVLFLAFKKFEVSTQLLMPLVFLNVIIFTGNTRNLSLPVLIGKTMTAVQVVMAVLMGLYVFKMAFRLFDSDGHEDDESIQKNEENEHKQ